MKWRIFSKDIKHRGKMLFWDAKEQIWFEGNLIDDSEYGLVISLYDTYRSLKDITHYLIIETP